MDFIYSNNTIYSVIRGYNYKQKCLPHLQKPFFGGGAEDRLQNH